jgi:hypothetical protein
MAWIAASSSKPASSKAAKTSALAVAVKKKRLKHCWKITVGNWKQVN